MSDERVHQLSQRLAMRARQIESVHRISAALYSKNDINSLLRETLHVALETVDADAGSILLYDKEKRVLVFQHALGGGAASLVGIEIDPETDLEGKAATVFRTGKPLITDTRMETHNRSIDNATGYRTDSILTVPLMNLGGEPIGVMQVINKRTGDFGETDLELMEIISSLAATSVVNARLAEEAQLAAVARAVGDLSHDIKNALTPIETMVDTTVTTFIVPMYEDLDKLLKNQEEAYPQIVAEVRDVTQPLRDWFPEVEGSVQDGCADIREMVGEIADYIKGAQATHMQIGSIKKVIEQRLRRLGVVAANRRVQIHLSELEEIPPFPFDQRLLGRAVFNLVNNALGAIDDAVKKKVLPYRESGFNIWIRTSVEPEGVFPEGNFCRITVEDDGPGIPQHIKDVLFTPQAISTTPGGTGIGTRFVRSVADAHGGEVGVQSEAGKGARFWIKLPLTPVKTAGAA